MPAIVNSPLKLRAIPAVALQALERMSDPDMSVPELAAILRNDPAIVSRLLGIANSAAYGLSCRVSDVQQVITLLGKPAVISIVLSIALAPAADIPEAQRKYYRRYWNESVMMATSVELLAKSAESLAKDIAKPSEYFTCGLLADVGRLALLQNMNDGYTHVLDQAAKSGRFPRDVEEELLETTHIQASLVLLHSWNAPEIIIEAVKHHHDSVELLEQSRPTGVIRALVFSAAMVDYLTGPSKAALLERAVEIGEQILGFTEDEVEKHIEMVLDRMTETADLFTIQPTDIDAIRGRFLAGLETAAVAAIADHVQAESAAALEESNEKLNQRLESMTVQASRDGLTGVFNREYFEVCLTGLLAETVGAIGLVFIDVDCFKKINDIYGHVVGDQVLKGIARVLQDSLRPSDLLARFGGDEFVVLARGASAFGLQRLADRLQLQVANTPFDHDGVSHMATVSVGGAAIHTDDSPDMTCEEFLALADAAMYAAKTGGKNRVHIREVDKPTNDGPPADSRTSGVWDCPPNSDR